jgi:RYK receptor-like tyrosine kinase
MIIFELFLFNEFCRVMDDLTVKLTDHALSNDLFPQDYDCLPTDVSNDSRPLKFMAIESINDRRFSTASDVVSFIHISYSVMYFLLSC